MHESRSVLIADTEACALGALSLRLNALGVEAFYANDLDEIVLLSGEIRERLGCIFVPAADAPSRVPPLIKRIAGPCELDPSALVAIGERPQGEARDTLRAQGLQWTVRDDAADADLRFAIEAAANDPLDIRMHLRVPAAIRAEAHKGRVNKQGELGDLGRGGAFFKTERPLPVGTQLSLQFNLFAKTITVRCEVRWVIEPAEGCEGGMGLAFIDGPGDGREEVGRYADAQIDRFRL